MSERYSFASWNVNGLRAVLKKDPGFLAVVQGLDADIVAIQETKLQEGQVQLDLSGYTQTWSYAEKKGYSGTAVFSREAPQAIQRADAVLAAAVSGGMSRAHCTLVELAAAEGRVCALEFKRFWLVNVYTPNAQDGLARIDVRMAWDDAFRLFLLRLAEGSKPVVSCGDFNVAHNEIDLKNPGPNRGNAGFSDEERSKFGQLLDAGFTDSFRLLHPDEVGAYSWWSYRGRARQNNAGWRIDYFLVSNSAAAHIRDATIRADITGSDHCPVTLIMEL